jgi:hypothetical protein
MVIDNQWSWQSVCPPRVARSLFAGATAGGAAFAAWYVVATTASHGPSYVFRYALLNATGIFVATFLVWIIALVAFAMGPWWIFHRIGFRNLFSAIVLGFSLTFLVDLAIASHLAGLLVPAMPAGAHEILRDGAGDREVDYVLTTRGWRLAIEDAVELGLVGMIVATVIWRTAYASLATRGGATPSQAGASENLLPT